MNGNLIDGEKNIPPPPSLDDGEEDGEDPVEPDDPGINPEKENVAEGKHRPVTIFFPKDGKPAATFNMTIEVVEDGKPNKIQFLEGIPLIVETK